MLKASLDNLDFIIKHQITNLDNTNKLFYIWGTWLLTFTDLQTYLVLLLCSDALTSWHVSWSHTILPSISQAIFSKWILVQGLSNSNCGSYTPQLIIMTTAVAFPTSHTMENNTDYNSLPPNLPSSGIYELWPKGI